MCMPLGMCMHMSHVYTCTVLFHKCISLSIRIVGVGTHLHAHGISHVYGSVSRLFGVSFPLALLCLLGEKAKAKQRQLQANYRRMICSK